MLGHRLNAEKTDRALDVLSHACCRRLLFELYEGGNSEEGGTIDYTDIDPLKNERRRILLYHIHLPKLEESGYIKWDEAEKSIQKGPRWEEIDPLLELIYAHLSELPPFLQGKPSDKTGKNAKSSVCIDCNHSGLYGLSRISTDLEMGRC